MNTKRYLLLVSCSKIKKKLINVPALMLYNGPVFKILRNDNATNFFDILIISAKYGLLESTTIISYYDQYMTMDRIKELSSVITNQLKQIIDTKNYTKIFFNLGKNYRTILENDQQIMNIPNIFWIKGMIGERLHQTKLLLHELSLMN